jgi:cytochrome P450
MSGVADVERIVEIAVIVAAMWPSLRACASATYRKANPRAAAAAAGALAVAGFLTASAAMGQRPALGALAALAGAGAVAAAWRARPGMGRARRLPPGRLTILPPFGAVFDRYFFDAQAEAFGPVFKVGGLRHPVVCVVGLARGQALLRDAEDALVVPEMPFSREIPGGFIRYQPPADHARTRVVLARALSRDLIDSRTPAMTSILHQRLDSMVALCRQSRDGGVAPAPPLRDATFACLADCLLGIAPNDDRFARLIALFRDIDHRKAFRPLGGRGRAALLAVGRLAHPSTQRCALAEIAAASPELARDPTVVGNVAYMVRLAGRDVADLLRWLLKLLAGDPIWLRRLREEMRRPPHAGGPAPLANRIVTEALRLCQSELIHRVARREVELDGFVVRPGWLVRICVSESHRDPRVFSNPRSFDPDRFLAGRPPVGEFMPFGAREHSCLGEHLTMAIACAFVSELAAHHDLAVGSDGPVQMGRYHWRPNRRFRVRLTQLEDGGPS